MDNNTANIVRKVLNETITMVSTLRAGMAVKLVELDYLLAVPVADMVYEEIIDNLKVVKDGIDG